MKYFVKEDSIVRQIWGKSDTILIIFAGAAAEFALNKAVDWLYFTGKLPADPLGRLFSTVTYAREIVFADRKAAHRAIDSMAAIHSAVESKRNQSIPDWAYRDVLFMLIDYSSRSFELLERKLSLAEKQEVFDVFYRMGSRMGIAGLPENFSAYEQMRQAQLKTNLQKGHHTIDLFKQYRKHLGWLRYRLLFEAQKLVLPSLVREMLGLSSISLLRPLVGLYRIGKSIKLDQLIKELLLPSDYKAQIKSLDRLPA